jgi:hypothetical protein
MLVAHTCNLSYSGGRDQEDGSSKPAQANSSQAPISKILITKRVGGVAQVEGPQFKSQYYKKKKKEREICSTLSWVAFPYKTLVGDLNKVCRLHK